MHYKVEEWILKEVPRNRNPLCNPPILNVVFDTDYGNNIKAAG